MFASLKRIYNRTHNETILDNAIKKGWLTEEEKWEIMGINPNAPVEEEEEEIPEEETPTEEEETPEEETEE